MWGRVVFEITMENEKEIFSDFAVALRLCAFARNPFIVWRVF
jgi:hypothetical protein